MMRTKYLVVVVTLAMATGGCSFLDFFGYEDNAPLHVVSRPSGYPSILFGSEMAATSYSLGEDSSDLVAVSAGPKYPTVIYRLARNGNLVDVEDPWDEYLTDDKVEAESSGSGASLVGLPTWLDTEPYTGCFAVGEPASNQFKVICEQDKEKFTVSALAIGETGLNEFGKKLAAIAPIAGDSWLVAAASDTTVTVFSSSLYPGSNRSETVSPTYDGNPIAAPIVEMTAGVLSDDTFFVAVTTADSETSVPERVHLFTQEFSGSTQLQESACLNITGEAGFGTVLASGDLDADGSDELIVSSSSSPDRLDMVYIWSVDELLDAAPTCNSDTPNPTAYVVPGDGPYKITCDDSVSCEFGFSIVVGDIATDDEGPELIVGAPGAKVSGSSQAGAVYVYRGTEVMLDGSDGSVLPASRVAHSTPEKNYRFGGGLAVAPMAGRNELLVGATGKGKMVVTYCTGTGEVLEDGADVTTNEGGSVVSTRCRPKK